MHIKNNLKIELDVHKNIYHVMDKIRNLHMIVAQASYNVFHFVKRTGKLVVLLFLSIIMFFFPPKKKIKKVMIFKHFASNGTAVKICIIVSLVAVSAED